LETLPDPVWYKYFGIGGKKLVLTFSEAELQHKAQEFALSNKSCMGRIGRIGMVSTFEIFQGKMTPKKVELYEAFIGNWPKNSWGEIKELGLKHPIFLPQRGCFGFINGHLIIGNRHHQEVMFRLINEKGWTWEQLVDAEQVWGWFYSHDSYGGPTVRFSSDAGTMTSKKVKNKCIAEFSEWFGKTFTEAEGYGGLSKSNYGGDFQSKYGEPGNWDGSRAKESTTIITPLPDPPEA